MNKTQLMGYLDQEPEICAHGRLREKATLSLSTMMSWQNEQGDWQRKTDLHCITVFKQSIIEWIKESIKSGDLLFVQGSLVYEETPGRKKKTPHIIVADRWGQIFRICENDLPQKLVLTKAGSKRSIPLSAFGWTKILETSNDN